LDYYYIVLGLLKLLKAPISSNFYDLLSRNYITSVFGVLFSYLSVLVFDAKMSQPEPFCTRFALPKFWQYYLFELVLLVPVVLFATYINLAPITLEPIIERDPTISYALVTPTISTPLLLYISYLVPAAIFVIGDLLRRFYYKKPSIEFAYAFLGECLMLVWSINLTYAINEAIKVYTGYPRPNFFALCDYQGYRAALATGNFTSYNALTTPGNFVDLANCRASYADILDSRGSFVSGHASTSFSAMWVATLYMRYIFHIPSMELASIRSLLTGFPLVIAAFISITRIFNKYHWPADVIGGALIGSAVGFAAWAHYLYRGRGVYLEISEEEAKATTGKSSEAESPSSPSKVNAPKSDEKEISVVNATVSNQYAPFQSV
jgi:membrane-associated phospholipid phosphatase